MRSGERSLPEDASARILKSLRARIEAKEQQREKQTPARTIVYTAWFRWSAAAILILLAGSVWRMNIRRPKTQAQVVSMASTVLAATICTNITDHDSTIALPDGSTVILSPKSTLQYKPAFEPDRRNIQLAGKALFNVTSDAARPFTVDAGDVNTTVLGTRFTVNTLTAGKVQVHLLEGRVVVRPKDKTLAIKETYLKPGQQFVLNKQLHSVDVYHDSSGSIPRKNNIHINTSILEFNQESLPHVLTTIGRKYGVVFKLNGHGFNTMLVTGRFLPSDSLQTVLSMLGSINGLSFHQTNDIIVVTAAHPR